MASGMRVDISVSPSGKVISIGLSKRGLSADAQMDDPYAPGFVPGDINAQRFFLEFDTDRSNTIDWQKLKHMLDSAYVTSPVSATPLTFSGNLCRYLLRAFSNSHYPSRAIATEGTAALGVPPAALHYGEFQELFRHIAKCSAFFAARKDAFTGQVRLSSLRASLHEQLPELHDTTVGYLLESMCEGEDYYADAAVPFQAYLRLETELQIVLDLFAEDVAAQKTDKTKDAYVRTFFYAR